MENCSRSDSNCSDRHHFSATIVQLLQRCLTFLCQFPMLVTSRSTDSQAAVFGDTSGPNQHRGYIWHVESWGLNHFLPCMLLWTRVIGTCQQDYLGLNHPALLLQDGGNPVGESLVPDFSLPLCVFTSSVSILFPCSWCRLSRPALHLAQRGLR